MDELSRIVRVADQMSTGYAYLRDQYALRARVLDFVILAVTSWLLAMTFVEPAIGRKLSPFDIPHEIWLGLLSIAIFVLAIMQTRVDWKARSDAYQRALVSTSEVVLEGRQVLANATPTPADISRVIQKYYVVMRFIEPLPEQRFLELKRRHRLKVAVSKLMDERPASAIWLLKLKMWIRDNCRRWK